MKKRRCTYFFLISLFLIGVAAVVFVKTTRTISNSSAEFETLQSVLSIKVPTDSVFLL